MKILDRIFVFSLFLIGALVLGGEYLDAPWMYNLAALGFGLVAILGGIQILVTGKARGAAAGMSRWYGESKFTERYSGLPARMIGVVALLFGCVVIFLGLMDLSPGGIDAFWSRSLDSPRTWGVILGLAGFFVTVIGSVRAKCGSAAAPGAYSRIVEAEFKVGGFIAAATGVAMIVTAAILIFSPGVLLQIVEILKR